MGTLRTYASGLIAAVVFAVAFAVPAHSLPLTVSDRVQGFATCAGRLSALMEYQWMFDGAGSERTRELRAELEDLLVAVLPEARTRGISPAQVLDWRIRAKVAQAALLQQARFATDSRRMRLAARQARYNQTECEGLLLS